MKKSFNDENEKKIKLQNIILIMITIIILTVGFQKNIQIEYLLII